MSSATSPTIASALRTLRDRLTTVSQQAKLSRNPTIVAVSKTKPISAIQEAYNAGQRHFGENYVVELLDKAPQLPSDIRWHFIGHLQSNKAKALVALPNLHLVESVDNEKLATALNKACADRAGQLNVLIQVNTSGEASKSGCSPTDAPSLFTFVLRSCQHLRPCGLMTIGRLTPTPDPTCFRVLTQTRDSVLSSLKAANLEAPSEFELSMGMTGDWEVAVQEGSSIIRVGSGVFGERDYGKPASHEENAEEADNSAAATKSSKV